MTTENKRYGVFLVNKETHRLDSDSVVINSDYKPLFTFPKKEMADVKCATLNKILSQRPNALSKQFNVVKVIADKGDIELYRQQKIAEEGKDIDTPERKARRLAELKAKNKADGLIK